MPEIEGTIERICENCEEVKKIRGFIIPKETKNKIYLCDECYAEIHTTPI